MRVYYLTPSQYALSSIALRRLKVARYNDLNDPFELLAVDVASKDLRIGILAKKRIRTKFSNTRYCIEPYSIEIL